MPTSTDMHALTHKHTHINIYIYICKKTQKHLVTSTCTHTHICREAFPCPMSYIPCRISVLLNQTPPVRIRSLRGLYRAKAIKNQRSDWPQTSSIHICGFMVQGLLRPSCLHSRRPSHRPRLQRRLHPIGGKLRGWFMLSESNVTAP